jgi:hypothetical protein
MKKTQRRKNNGLYISKSRRDRFRNILRTLYGERCCWCGEPMLFPTMGEPVINIEEMATIEHYFSKKENNPGYLFLLKLSHKKCNR